MKQYWVGTMNQLLVVYDAKVQKPESELVALYFLYHKKFVIYQKKLARAIIKKIKEDHPLHQASIDQYCAWLADRGPEKIVQVETEISERETAMQFLVSKLKQKHAKHIEKTGLPYMGMRASVIGDSVRTSKCYACKNTISSGIQYQCCGCGWMICSRCGVCGCGFDGL